MTGARIWAHPWDLSVRRLDALAAAGITTVSVASLYHAAAFLDPETLRRRTLRGATLLVRSAHPLGAGRLLHRAPAVDGAALVDRLGRRGLAARAWIVLHHDLRVTRSAQVRTVTGDHLPHAPCPTAPEVRQLDLEVARGLAEAASWDGIDLEGVGWHGQEHADHHPKRGAALDELSLSLASLCFCERCAAGFRGVVGPLTALRQRLIRVAGEGVRGTGGPSPRTLGPDTAHDVEAILDYRRSVVRTRLGELLAALGPRLAGRVRIQASADPLATGGAAPFDPTWPTTLEGLIVPGAGRSRASVVDDVRRLREVAAGRSIIATLEVPPAEAAGPSGHGSAAEPGMRSRGTSTARRIGADAISWYHLGMVPTTWTAALGSM